MGGGAREKKKSEIRLGENNKLEPLWIIKYSERMKDKRKNVLGPARVSKELLRQATD